MKKFFKWVNAEGEKPEKVELLALKRHFYCVALFGFLVATVVFWESLP